MATTHPGGVVAQQIHDFGVNLARAQDGSPPACQWLYESLAGRVAGYLRLHGATEPDDLTSEVFLRVFDNLRGFAGSESGFRSWVFTIAHRLLIDEHRRASRRPQSVELSARVVGATWGGDAEHDALGALDDRHAIEMLSRLKPDQRAVLTLRIIADLPIDEVADVLGKSPGAVKALQHRALASLRRQLAKETR